MYDRTLDSLRTTSGYPEADYWAGYGRGLRRSFHGCTFGTDAEHTVWLNLSGDRSRDSRREGYAAGYSGLTVAEAIRDRFVRGIHDAEEEP